MLTEIIEMLKNIALRHKGVKTFRYQDKLLNNAQNNYKPYQIYVDTAQYHALNITTNIFRAEVEMYVLAQPNEEKTILQVQDEAYTIACDILAFIDTQEAYKGVVSLYDYDILTLDHYTDDNSAGVKVSIVMAIPSPVNLCDLENNFNDEPYEEEPEQDITLPTYEDKDITLTTIKLPRNNRC